MIPFAAPLTLASGETLSNRLAKGAMTEGLADAAGRPTEGHRRLYATWGRGGAGLLITGNVVIDGRHLERPGNVVLDREPDAEMQQGLKAWAEAARAGGAGVWMQLSHAGRQTPRLINPRPKAPSAIAVALPGNQFGTPEPLTEDEIRQLIERFAAAARTARESGFTGVQIHGAHGYLISAFLSPRANTRTDAWGGSLANRARFLREIVRAVRVRVGRDFTVAVKLNSADFQKGGFAFDESLEVARWMEEDGVDVLEISGGSYEQPRMMNVEGIEASEAPRVAASTRAREAYFLEFAVAMRARVTVPLMVTGGFRSADAMTRAIRDDGISLIGLARPLCVDPAAPATLLAGAASIDRSEDRLRLGPGIFGPASPVPMLKALNGFAVMSWYSSHMRRLGAGQAVDPRLGVLTAFVREQRQQSRDAKARARAQL